MKTTEHDPNIGPDGWDKEAVYDNEIAPLVAQIIDICKREELPLLLSIIYRHSDGTGDGQTWDCTTHLPGKGGEVYDRFAECVMTIRRETSFTAFTITTRP